MAATMESDTRSKPKRSWRKIKRYEKRVAKALLAAEVQRSEETVDRQSPVAASSSEDEDGHDAKDPTWIDTPPPEYDPAGDNTDGDVATSAGEIALRALHRSGRNISSVITVQEELEQQDLTIAELRSELDYVKSELDHVNAQQSEKDQEIRELKHARKLLIQWKKADNDKLKDLVNFSQARALRAEQHFQLNFPDLDYRSSMHAQADSTLPTDGYISAAQADIAALRSAVLSLHAMNKQLVKDNRRLHDTVEHAGTAKKRKLEQLPEDDARHLQQTEQPCPAQKAQKIFERVHQEGGTSAREVGLFVTPEPESTDPGLDGVAPPARGGFWAPEPPRKLDREAFKGSHISASSVRPNPEWKAKPVPEPVPKNQQRKAEAACHRKSFAALLASIPKDAVSKSATAAVDTNRPRLGGNTLGLPSSHVPKASQPTPSNVGTTGQQPVHMAKKGAPGGTHEHPVELDDD